MAVNPGGNFTDQRYDRSIQNMFETLPPFSAERCLEEQPALRYHAATFRLPTGIPGIYRQEPYDLLDIYHAPAGTTIGRMPSGQRIVEGRLAQQEKLGNMLFSTTLKRYGGVIAGAITAFQEDSIVRKLRDEPAAITVRLCAGSYNPLKSPPSSLRFSSHVDGTIVSGQISMLGPPTPIARRQIVDEDGLITYCQDRGISIARQMFLQEMHGALPRGTLGLFTGQTEHIWAGTIIAKSRNVPRVLPDVPRVNLGIFVDPPDKVQVG